MNHPPTQPPRQNQGTTDLADFLEHFRPGAYVNFCSVIPDGRLSGKSFNGCRGAEAWIRGQNCRANCYYTLNRAPDDFAGKPDKTEITAIEGAHAEIDPRDGVALATERARLIGLATELMTYASPPTYLVDSGSGLQAAWLLADPIETTPEYIEAIETINRRLAAVLGADPSAWNVDRLLRVPGTTNYPDSKKIARGRPGCESKLIHADWGRRYTWPELETAAAALEANPPKHAKPAAGAQARRERPRGKGASSPMPEPASAEMVEQLLSTHPHLQGTWDRTKSTEGRDDLTDSGWDSSLACSLARQGYSRDTAKRFLAAYRDHHHAKPKRAQYYEDTVNNAFAFVVSSTTKRSAHLIIVDWLRERYTPAWRDSNAMWSRSERALVRRSGVDPVPAIIDALRLALEAPRNEDDSPKVGQLPRLFNTWLPVAWGALMEELPLEEDYGPDDASDRFRMLIARLLVAPLTLGRVVDREERQERRTVVSWCAMWAQVEVAREGDWARIRGFDVWARFGPDGLEIAIRPTLAIPQLGICREIGDLSLNKLARLLKKHGLGDSGRVYWEGKEARAALINAAFVSTLAVDDRK
jgi:hypothetical protein